MTDPKGPKKPRSPRGKTSEPAAPAEPKRATAPKGAAAPKPGAKKGPPLEPGPPPSTPPPEPIPPGAAIPEPPAVSLSTTAAGGPREQTVETPGSRREPAPDREPEPSPAPEPHGDPLAPEIVLTPGAGGTPAPHGEAPPARKPGKPEAKRGFSLLSNDDIYLFNEGSHHRLYDKLGAHQRSVDGVDGTYFAVWAPDAREVSVIGSFNDWDRERNRLHPHGHSGIWEGFVPGATKGEIYKFFVRSRFHHYAVEKADPFGIHHETPPRTGSVIWDLDYEWSDGDWMKHRGGRNSLHAPMSIYEVHLGSWRRVPEDRNRWLSYREIAAPLAEYVKSLGFTHVEFMPLTEHPFYGSWGYQTTGFFAPTSRYGTPQDLMYLIDYLHQNEIGVILDWVPSHFPGDEHGLAYFDGTHLFEHADPRQGFHPDWSSYIFNYGRNEVRAFLLSSAMFWLERFHVDGLRVDAVASMLYLDYSRKAGEWIPNKYGGRENLEAIEFLRRLNADVFGNFPDVQMIAEESTAWPMVSRPTYVGGLGFGLKWDMGWMHDTLHYMAREPIYRKYHHGELTFRMIYAFNENFVLPLSHDEVVHGKGSLIGKMPNDDWQKFANLRLLYSYMWSQPGKKLLFMGGEVAQWAEWNHESSVEWHLTDLPMHSGIQRVVRELNRIYRHYPALHDYDTIASGFEWIDGSDAEQSVLSYIRRGRDEHPPMVIVMNFTPVPRLNYRVGVPQGGHWVEVFNSDAAEFGGSGHGNMGGVDAAPIPMHGRSHSITITVPPLGAVFFSPQESA